MPGKKNLWKNISLVLVIGAICVILAEIGLRIAYPMSPFTPLLRYRPYVRMDMKLDIKGMSPTATHTTNKCGFRGDEPPKEWEKHYTMVAIGGSTTKCFYLDDFKTWPYLLQEKLKTRYPNAWVGNAGLEGHTTRAHVIFMEEVAPRIKPDAAIFLVGINDLGLSLREDRRLEGSEYERVGWKGVIYAKSRILQLLYTWKQIIFDNVTVMNRKKAGQYTPADLEAAEMQLPEDLKGVLPQLPEFRENIKKIIELGKSQGVKLVFMTQPLLFDDNAYWRGKEGELYWVKGTKKKLSAAAYWRLLDTYNRELINVCREEGVLCFDLASKIPHDKLYFYDPAHFNEKGAELIAEKTHGFLVNNL